MGINFPSSSDVPLSPMIPVLIYVLRLLVEEQFYLQIDIVLIMYHKFFNRVV